MTTDSHILVVEDEDDIRDLIQYNLEREGFKISTASDGEIGLECARTLKPDLVILDLMLPGIDGHEVCCQLRRDTNGDAIPIIMLTAKNEEADEIVGLRMGADDYITKPFSPRVLVARVKAVLRRPRSSEKDTDSADIVSAGPITIDRKRHRVMVDNQEVSLTPIEFKILHVLIAHPGTVFSRSQIIEHVLGDQVVITDRTVDVHVVYLRRKLGEAAEWVETVRGIGYRFRD